MSTIMTVGLAAGPARVGAQTLPNPVPPPAEDSDRSAPPVDGNDPKPPSVPAQAQSPALPAPDFSARLDEVEQTARIAARKQELFAEEAAKRAAESASTTIDDRGISIKSGDGAYVLKIRGLLQVDGRFFLDDDLLQDRDTFLIRRFRPSIEGMLFGLVDYRFQPDFAGSVAQVMDAYVDIHPWQWLHLRVGKMKASLGLERLQSDADLPFIERALTSDLSTTRDVGVQLWGDAAGGIVHYSVGVYNGGVDGSNADLDTSHAKDLVARLFFSPFRTLADLGNLGIGIAASIGNRKGLPQSGTTAAIPLLPAFRTAGQNTFFQYRSVTNPANDPTGTGTVFARQPEAAVHLNPQVYYFNGPFGLLGEYILSRQSVQRGNDSANLTNQAAHGTLTFAIDGKESYDGVTPLAPFDPAKGAWGALELAFRYDWLKIDLDTFPIPSAAGAVSFADPLANAHVARSWAVAVSYIPRRSLKIAVNFEQTFFSGGAAGGDDRKTSVDRRTENLLLGRVQVSF